MKKVGTTIYLTPQQRAALAKLEVRLGYSFGHLVREAINLLIAHYGDKKGRK